MLVQVTIREAMTDRLVADYVYELSTEGHVQEVILKAPPNETSYMIESRQVNATALQE